MITFLLIVAAATPLLIYRNNWLSAYDATYFSAWIIAQPSATATSRNRIALESLAIDRPHFPNEVMLIETRYSLLLVISIWLQFREVSDVCGVIVALFNQDKGVVVLRIRHYGLQ